MKKIRGNIFLLILILIICFFLAKFGSLIISSVSSKNELGKTANIVYLPLPEYEINIKAIENSTGCSFRILKTESLGYIPHHKFYWICLKKELPNKKLEELADAIIRDTILKKPKTYHSFTLHFFLENKLKKRVEKSKRFAKANFLPEGNWIKVGRTPIENYEDYELILSYSE